jgi:hypothetical protein
MKLPSIAVAAAVTMVAGASAGADVKLPTNEITDVVGLGGNPRAAITAPNLAGSGAISLVTTVVTTNLIAYVEFIPQYFHGPAAGRPYCIIQPNSFPGAWNSPGSNPPWAEHNFIWSSPPPSVDYFQDSVGSWHVGVSFHFQNDTATGTTLELDFICPQN